MRHTTTTGIAIILAALTQASRAGEYRFAPITGTQWPKSSDRSVTSGSSYTVFTGLADDSSLLYLTDNYPALRSDAVPFDGVEDQINDYVTVFGLPLAGQRRYVSESTVNNGGGSRTDTVRIRCVDAGGGAADLWPGGLYYNGIPLPHGGFGLGLDLPPELGGHQPMSLEPGTTITGLSIQVMSDGVLSAETSLPVDQFIFPDPSNWDGTLGLIAYGAADTSSIDSQIIIRITSLTVPEPGAIGLLLVLSGGLLLMRRIGQIPSR